MKTVVISGGSSAAVKRYLTAGAIMPIDGGYAAQ